MNLNLIFEKLWEIYTTQNPAVQNVYDLFKSEGEEIINDHIAFRTFNHPKINIDKLGEVFIKNGYKYIQSYEFPEKKLLAKHYENPDIADSPRVFISELKIEEFSDFLQNTVNGLVSAMPNELINSNNLIFSGNVWGVPSYKVYEALRSESEYAAWVYYNGFAANHFTVSVNHLKKYDTIQKVNELLKSKGFLINDSGGEIKGTPEELLEQSSIKSELFEGHFLEGEFDITGCYYEFAKRYTDSNGKLYSGFIAKSADKIFESTDLYKK
ncbi:MAG: DUF1338 domain-containing protein [Candidatus Kapabacteria bacterium]|nr:DUF1338 domain-containing protein [Ignavibacteriota bacterium]MCW5883508.1 DUF1338 domain-containing protein [Candidatus Kapabacteria bacterium]